MSIRFLTAIAAMLPLTGTWAAEHYVDLNSPNPTAPYSSWATAATNIHDAVDAALNDDTVWVTNGTYALTTEITVTNDIILCSVNGADVTIVDGDGSNRCFNLGESSCRLEGLTIQNGYLGGDYDRGGGVNCLDDTPVITNCVFRDNYARYGGGLSKGRAENCLFINNLAAHGGGMYKGTADHCVFEENEAMLSGGGMAGGSWWNYYEEEPGGTANHCSFINNKAYGQNYGADGSDGGGGLAFGAATNSLFTGNAANFGIGGGALGCDVYQCAFTGNSAKVGGGLGAFSTSIGDLLDSRAVHCTFTGNHAKTTGGGLYLTPAINCIAWYNSAESSNLEWLFITEGSGDNISLGRSTFTCSPDLMHGHNGNNTNAPLLVSSSHIAPGSPCVGAGTNLAYSSDIDGELWKNPPSMGCDEPAGAAEGPIELYIVGLPERIVVDYEVDFSIAIMGACSGFSIDLGDSQAYTNSFVSDNTVITHHWDQPGQYDVVLTAFNSDYPNGQSITQQVEAITAEDAAIYVAPNGNDSNSGMGWATAKSTIQAGVDAQMISGGTVWVTNGTYHLTKEIQVWKPITVRSVHGAESTWVDGGGSNQCFNLGVSKCILRDLTITHGAAKYNAGGIYCYDRTPVVESCLIQNNAGGGMHRGTANHCVFEGNTAYSGGGMHEGTANYCRFEGNASSYVYGGGGGMAYGAANQCVFIGNSAVDQGGGAYQSTAVNCVFTRNSAEYGGGMASHTYSVPPSSHAIHSTFFENHATRDGGGLYTTLATNCIVWNNTAVRNGDNLDRLEGIAFTCSPDAVHGENGNITNAPMLTSMSHIAPDSLCASAGINLGVSTDIDGEAWKNPPSIGCDEPSETTGGFIELEIVGLPAQTIDNYTIDLRFIVLGPSSGFSIDFGDGQVLENTLSTSKRWSAGSFDVVLTAHNIDYPGGLSVTQHIEVIAVEDVAIYVAPDGNDAHSGTSWAAAKATIQAGVDAQINPGCTVWVTNGTYHLTNEINVTNNIIVQSVHGMEATVVDGGGSNRCFNLNDSACVLRGFTIRNGYNEETAGGIHCSSLAPRIENSLIVSNFGYYGGGMYYGTALNCVISNNSATVGGGIRYGTAQQCVIRGNSARAYGGGLSNGRAEQCTISENSSGNGGGMYDGIALDCVISSNSSFNNGGGIYHGAARNCVISRNSTRDDGGGMWYGAARNCLVIGNTANSDGGGFYITTAYQCTLSGNSGGGIQGGTAYNSIIWYNEDYNTRSAKTFHCTSPTAAHGVDGNITNAPIFLDPAAEDYRLQSNSPCINWGNDAYVSGATDLDGNPRIVGAHVDMGAYEFQTDLGDDANGNGLSDDWERMYFGYPVLPTDNPDGDAASNGDEYIAGTNPTNAASVFAVTNVATSAEGFVVQWEPQEGRRYSVWWSDALTNAFQALVTDLPFPINSFTDTVHTIEDASFYQLEVELDD